MTKRVLDASGGLTTVWADNGDDSYASFSVEDGEPYRDAAKMLTDLEEGKKHDGMRLEAIIPMTVLEDSFVQGWFHDKAAWKRWANDPANRDLRVQHGGRVKKL